MDTRCQGTRRDGSPCQGRALPGERFCFAHSPTLANNRATGRREGGKGRSAQARAAKRLDPGLSSLIGTLRDSVDGVISGDLTPAQGSAVAALSRALVAVYETATLDAELATLRAEVDRLREASA